MKHISILFSLLFASIALAEPALMVKADTLREKPFNAANSLTALTIKQRVDIISRSGAWYQISVAGKKGWVNMLSVRKTTAATTASAGSLSNIVSGRSGTGKLVATTGIRGLNEENLAQANYSEAAVAAAEKFRISAAEGALFAKAGGLKTRAVPVLREKKSNSTDISLLPDLSDSDEETLGREMTGRLLATYPLIKNDKLQKYVNDIGVIVAAQSSRPKLHWTFGVINSSDINAFSAPGGYVFITAGLYQMIENEAELAGVLGHEITHVVLRHHIKLMQKTRALEQGRNFLLGKVANESVKMLAGNGSAIYARAMDQDAEFTCDRLGIQLAANAGYDPFATIALLDRLGALGESADKLALLYKTHPHPSDRLSALDRAIGSRWDNLATVTMPVRFVKNIP